MRKASSPILLFALAFCIALDLAPSAHASPERQVVRVDDLDRRTDAGANELLRRIERAADDVCGEAFARRYIAALRTYRQCRESTIAATVLRLGDDQLKNAYLARYVAF